MAKKRYIPSRFIYIDRDDKQTLALRERESGHLRGRRVVRKGEKGDRTFPRRVRGGEHGSPRYGGWILGRSPPVSIRGDNLKRGTIRRTL